mmetsp:Transcript_98880/g.176160  ORF Transcript_98880/g.176160 Transcript_98880/m.176160 type:complete len:85 (+) Transcript_98880:395-649(+)
MSLQPFHAPEKSSQTTSDSHAPAEALHRFFFGLDFPDLKTAIEQGSPRQKMDDLLIGAPVCAAVVFEHLEAEVAAVVGEVEPEA